MAVLYTMKFTMQTLSKHHSRVIKHFLVIKHGNTTASFSLLISFEQCLTPMLVDD